MKKLSKMKILTISAAVLIIICFFGWKLLRPNVEMNARSQLTKLRYEFNGAGVAKAMFDKDNLAVQHFIDAKIDPNIEVNNIPLLKLAIVSDNQLMFNYALRSGADVNSTKGLANGPTGVAINLLYMTMNIDFLEALLKKGADINAQDSDGGSLLHGTVNNDKIPESKKLEFIKALIKNGAKPTLHKEGIAKLGINPSDPDYEQIVFGTYAALSGTNGEQLISEYFLKLRQDRIPKVDKDCSNADLVPEGAQDEIIKVCKKACESKVDYGCFIVGLEFEKTDKALSIEHYKKGCELKDTKSCNFLIQQHAEIIPELKIECDKNGQARACALVASSFEKGRDRALEWTGDMLKYGKKACDLGDGYGCLMAGMSFVSLMNPDDQASIQKYGKLGLPYVTKACEMGWKDGCYLMKQKYRHPSENADWLNGADGHFLCAALPV